MEALNNFLGEFDSDLNFTQLNQGTKLVINNTKNDFNGVLNNTEKSKANIEDFLLFQDLMILDFFSLAIKNKKIKEFNLVAVKEDLMGIILRNNGNDFIIKKTNIILAGLNND